MLQGISLNVFSAFLVVLKSANAGSKCKAYFSPLLSQNDRVLEVGEKSFGSDLVIHCAQSDAEETDNIQGHVFPVVPCLGSWEEKAP